MLHSLLGLDYAGAVLMPQDSGLWLQPNTQQSSHLRKTGTCDDQLPSFLVQAPHDDVSSVFTVFALLNTFFVVTM